MDDKPIMRPSELRKAVTKWCAQGFAAKVERDGSITVTPPPPQVSSGTVQPVDLIQWSKR